VRPFNEDAFVIADITGGSVLQEQRIARFEVGARGVLLAVSDGLGGHAAGEVLQEYDPSPPDEVVDADKGALR
jgi:hypothetical protein